jgi:hypothetical protein
MRERVDLRMGAVSTGVRSTGAVMSFAGLWRAVNERAERVRLEYVFLVVALAWGVAQVFIVPPLQVPDEGDHWFRAWALTEGQATADPDGRVTLPGSFTRTAELYTGLISDIRGMPTSLDGQPGFTGYEHLFNDTEHAGTIDVVTRASNYGPVGYLPQAAGIGLGRFVGAPPLAIFYLARLVNFLAAVALIFVAIRLAPFGKQLFVLLALLPMTMFELVSVSCDAMTIAGAMLFTALLLWATTRATLRPVEIATLIAVPAIFLNIKPGYEALVLLVLLLKPAQLGGRSWYVVFVAASFFLVLDVFLVQHVVTGAVSRAQTNGVLGDQLLFVTNQPLAFLGILWSNLTNGLLGWILESIGILGWFTFALPVALYVFVLFVGVAFFFGFEETASLDVRQRAVLAAAGIAAFVTIGVVLFIVLPTPNGEIYFQGRYLAPVWLVLLLSVYGLRFARWRLSRLSMVGALLVIMVVNLQTLVSQYAV